MSSQKCETTYNIFWFDNNIQNHIKQPIANSLVELGFNLFFFDEIEQCQKLVEDWVKQPSLRTSIPLHLDTLVISSGSLKYAVIESIISYNSV